MTRKEKAKKAFEIIIKLLTAIAAGAFGGQL